VALTIPIPLQR